MDTAETITHVSLCAGYGGIDLGLKRAITNLRTIAFSEIEAFACANLVAKMEAGLLDAAPIWTDLKTFPWEEFRGKVDILSGGYPCQPFSAAGKRQGADDPRHLWPYIADGIVRMQPRVCFFENVEGHITLGLRDVLHDLAGMGYRTTWGIFSASEVGAPHQRKRVFILAYDGYNASPHFWSRFIDHRRGIEAANIPPQASNQQAWTDGSEGWRQNASSNAGIGGCWSAEMAHDQSLGIQGCGAGWLQEPRSHAGQALPMRGGDAGGTWPSRPGELQHGWEPPRVVVNSEGRSNGQQPTQQQGRYSFSGSSEERAVGNADGAGSQEWSRERGAGVQRTDADGGTNADRQTQPTLGRDADGPAGGLGYAELCVACDNRTDELRLLGNGVVPATAERAFRILSEELTMKGKL